MRRFLQTFLLTLVAAPALAQAGPPTLTIQSPPELRAVRARLDGYDLRPMAEIVSLVGLDAPGPPIQVLLATDDGKLSGQAPPWAAGYAIGEASLIVLFPSRSPTYPHDSLEDVLRHEVAHILISRAAGGRPVPRWFHEGLAVAVERPWALSDRTRLAAELLFGRRSTLMDLDALFRGDQSGQARAYSVSAAIVRDLMQTYGAAAPAAILRAVADGYPFDVALTGVLGRPTTQFETEFWNRQRTWTTWVPLLASSTMLWMGVMGLAAVARRRRRARAAALRAKWDEDDDGSGWHGGV